MSNIVRRQYFLVVEQGANWWENANGRNIYSSCLAFISYLIAVLGIHRCENFILTYQQLYPRTGRKMTGDYCRRVTISVKDAAASEIEIFD